MKKTTKILTCLAAAGTLLLSTLPLAACSQKSDVLTLRVSNWEEYIDLGGWDDDELIEIDNPYNPELGGVIGEKSMIKDFEDWFNGEDFGFKVKVEYSTFGTNEDLFNRMNLGDVYDVVCPSDYLLMQLIKENKAEKFSAGFHDKSVETNYYARNVSPYIDKRFKSYGWDEYAACYMLGTTGIVYNPDIIETEDVTSWALFANTRYAHSVTVKDNVRDSYFAALGIYNSEKLLSGEVSAETRSDLMNDTDEETVAAAQSILKDIKENVYAFETDSGKADMVTGKVAANYQWSGDAVYIMDQADADDRSPTELWYSVPDECTNLWFDGWIMLKDGINGNENKKIAAEAWINFLSRPDNAVRNMYYIGYTSAIAGENDMILDYMKDNYGVKDEDYGETEIYYYDVSYFFDKECKLAVDKATLDIGDDGKISRGRQLFAQYPPQEVIDRSVIMLDFGDRLSAINQMWINVRCLDVKDFNPAVVWSIVGVAVAGAAAIVLYHFRYQIFYRDKKEKKD